MLGSKTRSGLNSIIDKALYQRAAELFGQATELSAEDQTAFLHAQCGSDTDLQELLQNLLEKDREGQIEPELAAAAHPLPVIHEDLSGRNLSHYQIVRPMGAGGMGVVYRATDTRLQRTVALKFLPPFLRHDSASRERFIREAQVIASIDHQNVCPVYEIDEADEFIFIAMACLEGTSLEDEIRKGPITIGRALAIGLQTAYGLQAAHAKDVVHRDIKPGNLMLIDTKSAEPLLRILDFGIAQWTGKTVLTETELRIGTVLYMAPEQVAGRPLDGRADIWSLGVVLYQLLSNRLPFEANTLGATLALISGPQAADLAPIRQVASPPIVSVLGKMLAKDPAERYGNVAALISDLESVREAVSSDGTARFARSRGLRRTALRTALIAAVITPLVALSFLFFVRSGKPQAPDTFKIVPFTYFSGYQEDPAISPDGTKIAFAGQGKDGKRPFEIYAQRIGSSEPLPLTHVGAGTADRYPVWDRAGTRIAFLRSRDREPFARIFTVSALGGGETDLGLDKVVFGGRLSWNPNGRTLAFARSVGKDSSAIFELSIPEGKVRQRSFPAAGETDCCPQYDGTGQQLAFRRNANRIFITNDDKGTRELPQRISWAGFSWTSDGRALVYSWFGSLVQMDVASGSTATPPVSAAAGPDVSDVTIRGNRMAYVHWALEHTIWQLALRRNGGGRRLKLAAGPPQQLIASTMREDTPQFSADGQWIAFSSDRAGSTDIWVGRSDGTALRRLTFLDGFAGTPRWSPDGQWIAFDLRAPSAQPDIWLVRVSGGETRKISTVAGGADLPSWSNDGRSIYFHARSDDQIWKAPAAGGRAVPLTRRGGSESFESLDGRSLYYSNTKDGLGIWKFDLASGNEAPVPELSGTGDYRQWALGGAGIFFVPNDEASSNEPSVRLFDFATRRVVPVATVGKLVTAGPGALAVARDGTRLLYVHMERDNRHIMLVDNFK